MVGVNANSLGNPISIWEPDGKSEPGKNPILKVVSLYTMGDATSATVTVTATPSRFGVGFKLV